MTDCRCQVCGLKWSPDHQHLASGGNDNKLFVWNVTSSSPVQTYTEHLAAVKAIAWSPHQHGLLASGGGTADQCIRFWNTLTGQPLQCVDTGSQVCNLAWSKHSNELVSLCLFFPLLPWHGPDSPSSPSPVISLLIRSSHSSRGLPISCVICVCLPLIPLLVFLHPSLLRV